MAFGSEILQTHKGSKPPLLSAKGTVHRQGTMRPKEGKKGKYKISFLEQKSGAVHQAETKGSVRSPSARPPSGAGIHAAEASSTCAEAVLT